MAGDTVTAALGVSREGWTQPPSSADRLSTSHTIFMLHPCCGALSDHASPSARGALWRSVSSVYPARHRPPDELEHRRNEAQGASLRLFIQPVFKASALGIGLPPRRSIEATSL